MNIIENIIVKLKSQDTPFKIVEGIADLAAIQKSRPNNFPAAYVFIKSEASGDNTRVTGPVLQRTEIDFAVLIYTENRAGKNMSAAVADIENLKSFVRASLLGFVPDFEADAIEHISGEIISANNGGVFFEELYATAVQIMEQTNE